LSGGVTLDAGFDKNGGMNASLTRICYHLLCIVRRPAKWRFFVAGISRELALLGQPFTLAKA